MKNTLALIGSLCALAALIFSSPQVIASARDALALCASLILPSLFPFFTVSLLLSRLGLPQRLGRRLAPWAGTWFGVSGAGVTALLMGLAGGYPLGAAAVAELVSAGLADREEAERLLGFCNNSGPAFLVGAIGAGVFSSPAAGLLLYAAHVLAALLAGLLQRGRAISRHNTVNVSNGIPFYVAFPAAVKEAVSATLSVCGFVVCFSVLLGMLDTRGLLTRAAVALAALTGLETRAARALLAGFFELGSGVGALRGLPLTAGNLALAAALVGWGGLSVHCQTAAALADCELSLRRHTLGRLLSAVLSAAAAYLLALAFGPALW